MVRVVVTGGGTYGHVSPLEPIIEELRKQDADSETMFIAMKGDRFGEMLNPPEKVDHKAVITSGKYRRYPNESSLKRLFDIPTHARNTRDVFRVAKGTLQAYRLLKKFKPAVVFGNGGYVSVPVGWAASRLGIPLIIHESDALPGMANRLLMKKAAIVCMGMPAIKSVSLDSIHHVFTGIPVRTSFHSVAKRKQSELLKELNLDTKRPLIAVSGGSLGAEGVNRAILSILPKLLKSYQVVHIAGQTNEANVRQQAEQLGIDLTYYTVIGFTDEIDKIFAASSLVVTRASATTFSELAVLAKPAILIPGAQLSDQQENAALAAEKGMARVVYESQLKDGGDALHNEITSILSDKEVATTLAKTLHESAVIDSASMIAKEILSLSNEEVA